MTKTYVQLDHQLRKSGTVLTAWPELPEAIRAGIVAMVRAAEPRDALD